MNQSPHIELSADGDNSVWVAISHRQRERPIFERSVILWPRIQDDDSTATIRQKILGLARLWYDRHINLFPYCKRALGWRERTAEGVEVWLVSINAERVAWAYCWKELTGTGSFRFGSVQMCVDFIHGQGLSPEGKKFILAQVAQDIVNKEGILNPIYVRRRALITEFLKDLPPHIDLGREVAMRVPIRDSHLPPLHTTITIP